MKRILLTSVAMLALTASAGLAQSATDQIVSGLQVQGFTRIEIDEGPTQIKVEAIRGTTKVEYVYDRSTGVVLSEEVERVGADDDTTPGVDVDRDGDDSAGGGGPSDDGPNHDDDDDDDDDGFGHDDDDDDDDGFGHDDDDDDDDSGSGGSQDDNSGGSQDDNSGGSQDDNSGGGSSSPDSDDDDDDDDDDYDGGNSGSRHGGDDD